MINIDYSAPPPSSGTGLQQGATINTSHNFSSSLNAMSSNRFHSNFRYRQPFRPQHNNQLLNSLPDDFDGKRLRKSNMRKTVDYNCSVARMLQNRAWQRDFRDQHALQPDTLYIPDILPPISYSNNPINSVTTRFVKTATNKMRCPIFCMAWTPEGRRLVTGASSGEFTLWNGLTFNFETILQAHDSPVRSMVWSRNDGWMITGDHAGYCKYWQSNMNNVRMFQAHTEAIRGLSFSPTDQKIVSCSDDGTLRIWDFHTCAEERVLRGHGADVKCCGWHPYLGLIASGSKDNQQPIKLWDPKAGNSIATLHAHKATVMDLKWNRNGNWFITASRDHFLKLFDIRSLAQPVQTFRGHKKEASCIAWHPCHEGLLASGGSDGSILFWHVGADKEVGSIDTAHDSIVWTLDWHPLGHILASGSNDHTSKFWTRNRPGDKMRDRYNLNLGAQNSVNDDGDIHEEAMIPGMAPEDRVELAATTDPNLFAFSSNEAAIPGLEAEADASARKELEKAQQARKQPYAKPIPKNFVASWNETVPVEVEPVVYDEEEELEGYGTESVLDPITVIVNKIIEAQPGVKRVEDLEPNGIVAFGKVIPVKRGSKMFRKIRRGYDSVISHLTSGRVKELRDLPGFWELEQLYEYGSDSSDDDEGYGEIPAREQLNVEGNNLQDYLEPFPGFKETDLDETPYRDKEGREPPRGFGREDRDRMDSDRWDNEDRFRGRRDRDGRDMRDERDDRSRGPRGRREDRDWDRDRDRDWDRERDWDRDRDRFDDGPPIRMGPRPGFMGPPMGNFMGGPMGPNMMDHGPGFMPPDMMGMNPNTRGMNIGPNFGSDDFGPEMMGNRPSGGSGMMPPPMNGGHNNNARNNFDRGNAPDNFDRGGPGNFNRSGGPGNNFDRLGNFDQPGNFDRLGKFDRPGNFDNPGRFDRGPPGNNFDRTSPGNFHHGENNYGRLPRRLDMADDNDDRWENRKRPFNDGFSEGNDFEGDDWRREEEEDRNFRGRGRGGFRGRAGPMRRPRRAPRGSRFVIN